MADEQDTLKKAYQGLGFLCWQVEQPVYVCLTLRSSGPGAHPAEGEGPSVGAVSNLPAQQSYGSPQLEGVVPISPRYDWRQEVHFG